MSELLHLSRCPDCDYHLFTLPSHGRCPECGFAYDEAMIVLRGWGIGQHRSTVNAHPRRVLLLVLLQGGLLIQAVLQFIMGHGRPAVTAFAFWCLCCGFMLWRRRSLVGDASLPVQLRLFPAGFAQRDGAGEAKLIPWTPVTDFNLERWTDTSARILINKTRVAWWKLAMPVVECEVEVPASVLPEISERVQRWIAAPPDHNRGSTGSLSSASTPNTHS